MLLNKFLKINKSFKIFKYNYKKMNQIQDGVFLNNYIKDIKDCFQNQKNATQKKEIFFIMGNKSCDMDSFISVFLLSLFRNLYQNNKTSREINFKNNFSDRWV